MEFTMTTASIFKNGNNQAIRLPKDLEFKGVKKVRIKKQGNSLLITPVRKSWVSLADHERADDDFLIDRENVMDDENRVRLD